MKRILLFGTALILTLLLSAASLPAQDDHSAAAAAAADGGGQQMWIYISSAFGMAMVSSFAAIAMSISVRSFCEGVSRNPSASDRLQFGLILTLVLIETLALYVFAIIFLKVA